MQFVDESIVFSSPRSIKNLPETPKADTLNVEELKNRLTDCKKISEENYEKALKLNPSDEDALFNLKLVQLQFG